MKKGVVICGPDVRRGPLALFSGPFEERAAKAAAAGFDGVELMVRDPALLDWKAVKGCLDSLGLGVPQIVTGELFGEDGLCIVTADADLRRRTLERVRGVIDLAAYLGAMVNVGRLRGRLEYLGKVDNPLEAAQECFDPVANYAAEQGVHITLEPLNRYESDFILNVEDGLSWIAGLDAANVGLMLDLFHMNIEEPVIEDSLLRAGEKLWHVHIADTNRHYPGSAHMCFPPIFETLQKMGYQGYVSAELFPLPDGDTAGYKTIQFLKSFE